MQAAMFRPGVYFVGANDWNRRLFDSLIPLPDGTSYNSYLITGRDKTALLEAVDPSMEGVLLRHLLQLGIKKLDYVIVHHAEQDHSGGLLAVLEQYPEAKIVTNPRCKGMLIDLLHIPDTSFIEVQDGETLSLGDKTLKFIYTPWVHWPETMSTYLESEKILFSCDFFGSHIAGTDLFVTDEGRVHEAAKRYFAEIMMPFRVNIEKDLTKIQDLPIEIIAPSHGPMYKNPKFIMDLYRNWVSAPPGNSVVIVFTSMHGSTLQMVNYLTEALASRGVEVKQFDMSVADLGKIAMALVDAATLIVATPTVLAGPHPAVIEAIFLANALRPKLRFAGIIGSYLWGGKTTDVIKSLIPNLNVQLMDPVMVRGLPRDADFENLQKLAGIIAENHTTLESSAPSRT